jgi:hypothetical protein
MGSALASEKDVTIQGREKTQNGFGFTYEKIGRKLFVYFLTFGDTTYKCEPNAILIYGNGYATSAPDETSLECWWYWDSLHIVGTNVYFGVKIANYEDTSQRIRSEYLLDGPKKIRVRQMKTIPAKRFMAYFIAQPLSSTTVGHTC